MPSEGTPDRTDAELSVVLEIGGDEAETMPVVLRPLRSRDDYRQCEALERETWGQDFSECVPSSILMISQKVGGVAAGAFDSDGRMVGMVYGLTGPRRGEIVHWSHMLAACDGPFSIARSRSARGDAAEASIRRVGSEPVR